LERGMNALQSSYKLYNFVLTVSLLLLGGELLTERCTCRTDNLMPDLPVPSLPPCRMDPKVLLSSYQHFIWN